MVLTDPQAIICALLALVLLVALVSNRVGLHPILGLFVVSVLIGIFGQLPLDRIVGVVRSGAADSFAHQGLVIVLGSIYGRFLIESGVTKRIGLALVSLHSTAKVIAAVIAISVLVGLPLFFEAGMIIIVPIVYSLAHSLSTKLKDRSAYTVILIPAFATLLAMHGLVPPHPGPTLVAHFMKVNISTMLVLGLAVAVPVFILCGPVYGWFMSRRLWITPGERLINKIYPPDSDSSGYVPSAKVSFFLLALPVIIILPTSLVELFGLKHLPLESVMTLVGEPVIAMLLSSLFVMGFTSRKKHIPWPQLNEHTKEALTAVASLVILLSMGGAFSRMLITIGVGDAIKHLTQSWSLPVIIVAWVVAAGIGASSGSATIAASTAAQLCEQLDTGSDSFHVALVALVVSSGSLFFSYTNHGSYWMVKDSFGLTLKQTNLIVTAIGSAISIVAMILISIIYVLT